MHYQLSIIRGRGDVVTRSILLLSVEAYAMQLCKQGLERDDYQWRVSSGPREPVTSKIKAVRRKYFLSFLPRPVWIIIIANP